MPGDEFNLKCIELDIKRTFCNHEFFQTPQGYVYNIVLYMPYVYNIVLYMPYAVN